ncbi:MAG: YvcK family protein [Clostridiales Family XIII bacterium]|jgi:uncharacterized cofD-like protein|nr:YvcK family protein [Clostridiales Family XIII bacterium]
MTPYSAYKGPRIVVIGGGTGLSVLLRGLKRDENRLAAVVTVADDGGSSGILREDLGMLPPGDVRSCLLALADEENAMQEILRYRFKEGLAGQNIGNLMLAALNDIYGSFEEAVARTADILKVQGRVIPVTGEKVHLVAELHNGSFVLGESRIPGVALKEASPIKRVFLSPAEASASEAACQAVAEADIVLIGPGSLYTSIIPNFLSRGLPAALSQSKGRKIYVCNVMTQPGETDGYSVRAHVEALLAYVGEGNVGHVLANNRALDGNALSPYAADGAQQVLPDGEDREYMKKKGITMMESDFIETKKRYIRHDSAKIAELLAQFSTSASSAM